MTLAPERDLGTPAVPAGAADPQVSLTIDGRAVTVPLGTSVMRAAAEAGVDIPRLCATDTLAAFGSCRLCLVEVEGGRGTPASCTTPCADAMVVQTRTEQVQRLRQGVMELYLSDHPADCPGCARGSCDMQRLAHDVGLVQQRYAPQSTPAPEAGRDESNPYFAFEPDTCIVCSRCVRACAEVQGTFALTIAGRGEALVVQREVELVGRQVGPQRPTDLDGADRPARPGPAAVAFDELADGQAELGLDDPAPGDIAAELEDLGAVRAVRPQRGVCRPAVGEDHGDRRQGEDIVDHGGLTEEALQRRDRGLGPDLAAAALEALQHRGLLAADVRPGPDPQVQVEADAWPERIRPEDPLGIRDLDRPLEHRSGVRVLGAEVDEARPRADGVSGAKRWTPAQRLVFAQDVAAPELWAVAGSVNFGKAYRGADSWTPPAPALRCRFATAYVVVKVKYDLTVTAAERASLSTMLATCRA